jgi:hypothetical protein
MAGASTYPTASDLIIEALTHLGVYAPGDALQASDLASAFFTLQGIVDGWGAQPLTIFNRQIIGSFSATAGKGKYTLGTANTNDWVTSFLPPVIDLLTMSMGTLELQIAVDTAAQWESIGIKSLQSNIINECWPNYGAASHELNFYPVPNQSIPINLYLLSAVQRLSSTAQVVQLPPAYQEFLTFELVIKCSTKFGAPIPEWIPAAYQDARTNVKAANFEPLDMQCDPALVSRGARTGGAGLLNFYLGR